MVSITRLDECRAALVTAATPAQPPASNPPTLNEEEFRLLMTAVRFYKKNGLGPVEGETKRARWRRYTDIAVLNATINRLRNEFNPMPTQGPDKI